jgi:hypothetical protein
MGRGGRALVRTPRTSAGRGRGGGKPIWLENRWRVRGHRLGLSANASETQSGRLLAVFMVDTDETHVKELRADGR